MEERALRCCASVFWELPDAAEVRKALHRTLCTKAAESRSSGGIPPNETSASTLATAIASRGSEEWTLKGYLTMDALKAVENPNSQLSRY